MAHKITGIEALPHFRLKAVFENGETRVYSIAPLQKSLPAFRSLSSTPGLFERARVDSGGYAVVWNDELDLASEEIWHNGLAAD